LVKAGDVKGLRAMTINTVSSSPKAMLRFRDLAIVAITAKAKSAKDFRKWMQGSNSGSQSPAPVVGIKDAWAGTLKPGGQRPPGGAIECVGVHIPLDFASEEASVLRKERGDGEEAGSNG
jgi:hypothetical protein